MSEFIAQYHDGDFYVYAEKFKSVSLNNANVVRYNFGYTDNPDLHFEEWDKGLLLYCKDIPVQEFKRLNNHWLSEKGRDRWNTWGPERYGISFDEMNEVYQYCKWCPQGGFNAHNVYGNPPSEEYSLSSVMNEIDLRNKYANLEHVNFQFYDRYLTADRVMRQLGQPTFLAFDKKYGITEKLRAYTGL